MLEWGKNQYRNKTKYISVYYDEKIVKQAWSAVIF